MGFLDYSLRLVLLIIQCFLFLKLFLLGILLYRIELSRRLIFGDLNKVLFGKFRNLFSLYKNYLILNINLYLFENFIFFNF